MMKNINKKIRNNTKDKWNIQKNDQDSYSIGYSEIGMEEVVAQDVKYIDPDTISSYNNSASLANTNDSPDINNIEKDFRQGSWETFTNTKPILWTQVLAAIACALVHLGVGAALGFTGVLLPDLTDSNSTDIYLNTDQVAIFTSINNLGSMGGALSSGLVMTWIGQRFTLLITLPLGVCGWIIMATAKNFVWLVLSRLILGFVIGTYIAACHNYVAEISHSSVRGRLLAISDLLRQFGAVFIYILGSTQLHWRSVSLISGLTTLIPALILLYFLPNSPRWLSTVKRNEEARAALTFFRGTAYDVDKELKEIFLQAEIGTNSESFFHRFKILKQSNIRKRFICLSVMMLLIQFTGNLVVLSYSVSIFKSANTDIDEYVSTIISGSMRILGAFANVFMADRFRRKILLTLPLCLSGVSISLLGLYFYLKLHYDLQHLSWVPLVLMCIYLFTTGMYYPVFMLVRTEILPTSIRSAVTGYLVVLLSIGMFVAVLLFPYMVNNIGYHSTFWIYGGTCFFISFIAIVIIPETRGKTLEEIDRLK